jgi:hypothetical protein
MKRFTQKVIIGMGIGAVVLGLRVVVKVRL